MRNLVYFASGPNRPEYQKLGFDRIILIDNCFKKRRYPGSIFTKGKVTCIGMDSLESIKYLKKENIKIDCFVSLNEGLYEGGGKYPINSDMFLGYVMPLFKDEYIHIMNKNYYCWRCHVTMDLPFRKEEIQKNDTRYLDPFIFSQASYHQGYAKVFQMTRITDKQVIELNPKLKLEVIHDSIWNFYDTLDVLVLSCTEQGQLGFFNKIPKVLNKNYFNLDEIFNYCELNKVKKIGFTPWARGNYDTFINTVKTHNKEYPREILLFHLNSKDYMNIKTSI